MMIFSRTQLQLALLVVLGWLAAAHSAHAGVVVNNFTDITNWTGSGTNRAAVVIDWGDGKDALVWGYRFDNAVSSDMLRAVVEADPRLFAKVQDNIAFGQFVTGLGYDRGVAGTFAITTGTNFGPKGFVIAGDGQSATASDTNDSYLESGGPSYWNFANGSGPSYPGGGWQEATTGISTRVLSDQSWDGYRFVLEYNPNVSPPAPGVAFAAVPEPSGLAVLMLCGGGLVIRRRRRAA